MYVDELGIEKLQAVPVNLGKLSNVVNNVVKKLCTINYSVTLLPLILVDLLEKLNVTLINQVLKRKLMTLVGKYLIRVELLKNKL